MQKAETMQYEELFISFFVYQLRPGRPVLLHGANYEKEAVFLAKQPVPFVNMREVSARYNLHPGHYIIIPCTFHPHKESDFLLRVYTERKAEAEVVDVPSVIPPPTPAEDKMEKLFLKHSGGDKQMDAMEMKSALNEAITGAYFDTETSRALLALMDRDMSGYLNVEEFKKMMKEVKVWKDAFVAFDTDKSGSIDTYELSKVFKTIGFTLSRRVLSHIVRRYGGKRRRLGLEDFVHCCSRIVVMYSQFAKYKQPETEGKAQLSLEEWLATTLYY